MSNEQVQQLQERVAALEKLTEGYKDLAYNVEWLIGGYKDLAYEHLNNVVKRIEDIRTEVLSALANAGTEAERKAVQAIEDGIKSLEEVRDKVRGEVVKDIAEEVLESINDGSHGMVRVAGKPHPVLKRIT